MKPTYPRSDEVYRGGVKMLKDAGVEVYVQSSQPIETMLQCWGVTYPTDWIKIIKSTATLMVLCWTMDAPWSAADEKPSGLREMYAPAARMVREAIYRVCKMVHMYQRMDRLKRKPGTWKIVPIKQLYNIVRDATE